LRTLIDRIADRITHLIRQHIFTRENLWAVIIAAMILLVIVFAATGTQPPFVYGGF
jgi:hypothetical protein